MELEDLTTPVQLVACPKPGCQAPAAVVDRFLLPSTDGPVEHVKTWCANDHGLTPRTESVESRPISQVHQPPRAAGA